MHEFINSHAELEERREERLEKTIKLSNNLKAMHIK